MPWKKARRLGATPAGCNRPRCSSPERALATAAPIVTAISAEPIKELRRLFTVWRVRALTMEGYRLLETKDFTSAITLGEEVVALDPSGESYYNSACFLARAGRVKEALGRLQEAIARNPKLAPRAAQDADLEVLRDTDGFKQIIGK